MSRTSLYKTMERFEKGVYVVVGCCDGHEGTCCRDWKP